jgi:hypothetical protein
MCGGDCHLARVRELPWAGVLTLPSCSSGVDADVCRRPASLAGRADLRLTSLTRSEVVRQADAHAQPRLVAGPDASACSVLPSRSPMLQRNADRDGKGRKGGTLRPPRPARGAARVARAAEGRLSDRLDDRPWRRGRSVPLSFIPPLVAVLLVVVPD